MALVKTIFAIFCWDRPISACLVRSLAGIEFIGVCSGTASSLYSLFWPMRP